MSGDGNQEQYDQLRKRFAELKPAYQKAAREKEQAYRHLRSITDKIKSRNKKIQDFKVERDELTDVVKEAKELRNKLNSQVKNTSQKHKELRDAQTEVMNKHNLRKDPVKIQKEIERIETQLETEIIPFAKEKKLRKHVAELRGSLSKVSTTESGNIRDVRKELKKVKDEAESAHAKVQELAQASQEKHERITKLFNEIKGFRDDEKVWAQQYKDLKAVWVPMKEEMDQITAQMRELEEKLGMAREQTYKEVLAEKSKEVKDKIKKGKKLSTEDLLAFQAMK